MKHTLIALSLAAATSLVPLSQASAWTRSGSVTTWRGTYTGQASGSCAGGTCTRTRSVTGPNGNTITQSGSVSRTGPYRYDYSRTTTGTNGNSVTRSGTAYANPYRYPYWARY